MLVYRHMYIYVFFVVVLAGVVINSHFSSYDPLIPELAQIWNVVCGPKRVIMTVLHINLTCDACPSQSLGPHVMSLRGLHSLKMFLFIIQTVPPALASYTV